MRHNNYVFFFQILGFLLLLHETLICHAWVRHTFEVKKARYTRLCSTKEILTVNGQFPGPTLYVHKGETTIVDVINKSDYNITIHWHGVKQPRNPWSDGPEYITQCPIKPGGKFTQKIIFSTEEGTLWWHAHSDWSRATVHGAIVIRPKIGTKYPFPEPYGEQTIILGEWWKNDIVAVYEQFQQTGGDPNISDAYLINGQPGDLYPCSKKDTFKMTVHYGKTYLLRLINAAMQDIMFFAIHKHHLTVVGTDASYTKPLTVKYLTISPGQTIDVLLKADQPKNHYYMAARVYSSTANLTIDNTTTTAVIKYRGNYTPTSPPRQPYLPPYNDTSASVNFTGRLRSLASKQHPINCPRNPNYKIMSTVSIGLFPCGAGETCAGPNNSRVASSMNNISFVTPSIDILQAYYKHISGVYEGNFPSKPPLEFNYTGENLPLEFEVPEKGTKVKVLEYGAKVEWVFQGTGLTGPTDHPMHVHGTSFYVVGWGFGNFDKKKDPKQYNLVDPPLQNTIAVPKNGWSAIRFEATNPGVWFVHCHIERHMTWGMEMAYIVKNGPTPDSKMLPPPHDMPPC